MNCKILNLHFVTVCLLLLATFAGSTTPLYAQSGGREVKGTIVDETKEPLIGVTVMIPGTSVGTITNFDGHFQLNVPVNVKELIISYIGYESATVQISPDNTVFLQMKPESFALTDVVVIGYGTNRKSDLTGSISSVSSKDFNGGLLNSPEQLINGKVPGVQIVSGGGSPTSESTIRIRGGASLNASNDPLIVLDGVPLETGGIRGSSNFLNMINPADIENMTILKDASSTAIYGSRASNGVILITTKKGGRGLKVDVSTTHSIQQRKKDVEMLTPDEYRMVINQVGSEAQKGLLGNYNTNWNDEIFRLAYGTDNNVSISSSIADVAPIRFSVGYYNQQGILQTDKADRWSGNFSISPSFFQDHLKLNASIKASINNNRFGTSSAIYNASAYNPTIGVYSGNDKFGGYNEALDPSNGTPTISGQVLNPVGLLKNREDKGNVGRVVGNFDVNYKFHFLPELRANLILGYDYAKGKGSLYVPEGVGEYYATNGRDYEKPAQKKDNQLLTFYLNYLKDFDRIKSRLEVTGGYDYQKWKSISDAYQEFNIPGDVVSTSAAYDYRHVLVSFYGRVNYSYDSKYLLTATVRHDGSSRFSKDHRWSTFPSVALAWRLTEEEFMKGQDLFSNIKVRASFGITGQQDGISDYSYIPVYTISQEGAQYPFGDKYYYTWRPEAYVSNLKWESTESYNVGLDLGLLNNRLTFELDYYTRKTKDLLAKVPSAAGSNFDKEVTTNVGNMKSEGFEMTMNAAIIDTRDWSWDMAFNMTWQKMKITNLSLVDGVDTPITYVGGTSGGKYLQILKEGYTPYTFYLHKQVYDEKTGRPIEGMYVDRNNDGQITDEDRFDMGSPFPDFLLGLNSQLRYKKWTLGFSLRANLGLKVFNNNQMRLGATDVLSWNTSQIQNLTKSYLDTRFETLQYTSDYYLENGNFLKMDNISLGYNFGKIGNVGNLNVSGMVQNAFTITKYSGVDPEIYQGIESSFYPRARIYSINVGLQF